VLEYWSNAKKHFRAYKRHRGDLLALPLNLFWIDHFHKESDHIPMGLKTRPILLGPIFTQHSKTPVLHLSGSRLSAEPLNCVLPINRISKLDNLVLEVLP
jgi:hypothetical protein